MNKVEKLICLVLGAVLAWYVFWNLPRQSQAAADAAKAARVSAKPTAAPKAEAPKVAVAEPTAAKPAAKEVSKPTVPERLVTLGNDEVIAELSSWGAVVRRITLKRYARGIGEVSAENPAVVLDFSAAPMGALEGLEGVAANAAYELKSSTSDSAVFVAGGVTRRIALEGGYRLTFEDDYGGACRAANAIALGSIRMGDSKNDLLSVDSWALDAGKGKPGVIHHSDDDSPLKPYLVGGLAGGCSGSKSAAGMPVVTQVAYPGVQQWVALKNRFFVVAACESSVAADGGMVATVTRDPRSADYRPESVAAKLQFQAGTAARKVTFYAGPKKQALLWDLGMKDVMEFGMWRWICYPLVWVLNVFHDWVPNFGIAIILLTILVRIIFWPLTHKSTVGMKKMQELQPKLKAIQAEFKDNQQRLQQEIWALYKAEKVNPMSSCLPMLIQIPVFIALFNVLRSAVELRYAPFLWIADLSEPEGLLAAYLPFGGLNLLPILMAVTTGLQSAFTPSTGDKSQQKMMMIFMPIMMLVMFYSFPSALSLYWFLSNLFSIAQMWIIRRQTAKQTELLTPEVIDPPQTRQMRRHA